MIAFGREICGDWDNASSREWLVTNGAGGFACGTLSGAATRRYHGLLVASFKPPVERRLLVAKVELSVEYRARSHALSANEFADGTVDPRGFELLESFRLEDGLPVWRYAIDDALLEQRIFMAPGANTTYLRLEVLRATAPLTLQLKPLVTDRDYHAQNRGAQPLCAIPRPDGCTIEAPPGTARYRLRLTGGERAEFTALGTWYWNFLHREERARGLDALEDLWEPGVFTAQLDCGHHLYFTASSEPGTPPAADTVLAAHRARAAGLCKHLPPSAPPWIRDLAIASDAFIVRRGSTAAAAATPAAHTILAGYPWFTDWGRDTMIALPGLTTILGRADTAASILRTFAAVIDRGMLPNRFPDAGETLEYNTADATLWFFEALAQHVAAAGDETLRRELFPALLTIIRAHVDGTRYGIHVDPADGLLHAGQPGTQLTWMDAKRGDQVFTPRSGKPVEINALWLNALGVAKGFARDLGTTAEREYLDTQLARATTSFARFWNADLGCLYDVIDVDGSGGAAGSRGADPSIRPNQLFAVALPRCVLPPEQQRAVVDTVARELLTSYGLRSLSARDPRYVGRYTGDAWQRDGAYHQGTVWAWLLGPFALAHYRVYGDARAARAFLAPVADHLAAACVGSVSEIFEGDAPHTARGCFAQAWSVAEILRAWVTLERHISL